MQLRTFYSNPTRPEKELGFFETFLSAKMVLHIEKWEKRESPDYILHVAQEKIGLELTTLVINTPNKGVPLASIRAAQEQCLKKAAKLANQSGLAPVEVKVKFRSDDDPIAVDIAAKELVEFLKNEIPKIDDSKYWHYYESGLRYSQWIIIHLGTANGQKCLQRHRFQRIHANWMLKDPIDEIQSRIDEKQTKYPNYLQHCDKCWLLIGVDEWTAPEAVHITEETESHVFSGDFEQLFFLLNIEGRLVELKITHR